MRKLYLLAPVLALALLATGASAQGNGKGKRPRMTSVIVQTSPAGLAFTVDGVQYSSTQAFDWTPGSEHTIATSPQAGGVGTQYAYASWSDGGAMSHTVAPSARTTYTVSFTTQYQLTMSAGTGGSVTPASGGFYDSGQRVVIDAVADAGYRFSAWAGTGSGSYSGSTGHTTVTMNGPITQSAAFEDESTPPPPPPPPASGIWIGEDELALLPMSGADWSQVSSDGAANPSTPNVGSQDSQHDIYTLAAALTCVRNNANCTKARSQVVAAIGTEGNNRWLAISRNLGGYIIAADLLGLRDDGNPDSDGSRVEAWIRSFLTRQLPDNNTGVNRHIGPFHSGSNAAAQEGFIYAAIGAYINDTSVLNRAWDAFRTYACDPTAPDNENIDLAAGVAGGWAYNDSSPCAVNPLNSTKVVPGGRSGAGTTHSIDGAVINDIQRGGAYQWEPAYTDYVYTGAAGFIPAAVILERAGYPAMSVADEAVRRSIAYLWFLRADTGNTTWFTGARGSETVSLVNHYYGTTFPKNSPVNRGHTVGYTGWTHPNQ
ncbi:MAG: hypothetical protein EHM13_00940 [Acidobacteria bacterium]|nr:MAG: hypothetical protein EHM13_00940 [Acidobacteriota bacterium]